AVAAGAWARVGGEGGRVPKQIQELLADGYRLVVAADGKGSGARLAGLLRDEGLSVPFHEDGYEDVDFSRPGGHVVVEPLERGFVMPSIQLPVLSESHLT